MPDEIKFPGFFDFQAQVRETARYLDVQLKELGLTNVQASVMLSLRNLPGVLLTQHAACLGMDRTTLRSCARGLIKRGLVEECTHAEDRRASVLVLSEEGENLVERAIPIMKAVDIHLRT